MGRCYGLDLRRRVVDAIDEGLSARGAARRFSIGFSTAINWHRQWREEGTIAPKPQGQPRGSKLDAHEAYILALVESEKDIALHEIAARLAAERGVTACPSTLWNFFDKRGITVKKRLAMHRNNNARMSLPDGKPGSRGRPSSTRRD